MVSFVEAARFFFKLIRIIYIGGAIYFVCYGCYTTLLLVTEGNLIVKDEVKVLQKHKYPSVTFCYVFKEVKCKTCQNHRGVKHVWNMYYRHYIEKWKQSGMLYSGMRKMKWIRNFRPSHNNISFFFNN